MYDASGTVIYVGKAKDLKKRLSSYFRVQVSSRKTETLVKNIAQIDVTVTHTETEALLLEHNYIKLYQPRYNVLLRDDKSYPLIFLPFISSAFVPTASMPAPVAWFAEHQPVTSIVNTIRALFAGDPVGSDIWVALAWLVGILIVAYAVAVMVYRRKLR